jgi:hypothetical protein
MTDLEGIMFEFIAFSYLNTNNQQKSCYLANLLVNANYIVSADVSAVCGLF